MNGCVQCGSEKEVRDGYCFRCRIQSVTLHTERLRHAREADVTHRQLEREIVEGAREDGRDIQRVGKVWT